MEKVLVTGANGFVGANLVRRLVKENYEVHIIIRQSSDLWRIRDVLSKLHQHVGDLLDNQVLQRIVDDVQPDHIVHLAIFGGRPKQSEINTIVDVNFRGTMNLVESCKHIPFKTFINGGSSSEYGTKKNAMKETDICEPINVYGVSKIAATLYCQQVAKLTQKNIGTIRLFSPFGDYEERGRLFPDLILNAIDNKPILLANPNAVRDFIYIEEVIDLFLMIIKECLNIRGEVFNCGFGVQHSVADVTKKVLEITQSKSSVTFGAVEGRLSDTEIWVADMEKTTTYLNWNYDRNFDHALEKACKWFKENRDLYL